MSPEEFNKYCATVMGYWMNDQWMMGADTSYDFPHSYRPYSDMNQLAEVFDRLWEGDPVVIPVDKGIRQSMIDFIWSTREA